MSRVVMWLYVLHRGPTKHSDDYKAKVKLFLKILMNKQILQYLKKNNFSHQYYCY